MKQFSPANWGKKLPEWLEQPPTRVDGSRTMVSGLQALTITGIDADAISAAAISIASASAVSIAIAAAAALSISDAA